VAALGESDRGPQMILMGWTRADPDSIAVLAHFAASLR